jgi:sugar phosphate isomerase/epimerase
MMGGMARPSIDRSSCALTRRAFLARTGTIVAAGALLRGDAPGPRFGVRSPFPTSDLAERARLVRRLGFDGIELGPEYLDRGADDLRRALGDLPVSAIVGSLKLLEPDPSARAAAIALDRDRLGLAKALGAGAVIEVPMFGDCKFPDIAATPSPHAREDDLLVEALKALAPDLLRTGVTLLLEPLTRRETHYMNLQAHGARVIARSSVQGVALLSDFYHMQMEEPDVAATLAAHGARTAYVHLADGAARTEPGSLPFDYRPGFRALKRAGFRGWLTMECKPTDHAEAALSRALAYVKQQWAEA